MRRSRLIIAFLVPYLAGLGALAAVAATDRRTVAFTLGVTPGGVVAPLRAGQMACESGIDVPAAFDAVEPMVGTYFRPGPPLSVEVRSADGRVLGRGRLPAGYADNTRQAIRVGQVRAGERISVCISSPARRVALYGNAGVAAPDATMTIDGRVVDRDLTLRFRQPARSALSEVPQMFERASLFKAGGVGTWTFWALAALVLLGGPAVALVALFAAERARRGDE